MEAVRNYTHKDTQLFAKMTLQYLVVKCIGENVIVVVRFTG